MDIYWEIINTLFYMNTTSFLDLRVCYFFGNLFVKLSIEILASWLLFNVQSAKADAPFRLPFSFGLLRALSAVGPRRSRAVPLCIKKPKQCQTSSGSPTISGGVPTARDKGVVVAE